MSALDFHLPAHLIAQHPLPERDQSRLMMLSRTDSQDLQDRRFAELPSLLRGDELLVLNNAKVIPARLFGCRLAANSSTQTELQVEILLSRQLAGETWEALVRPGKKVRVGHKISFGNGELLAEVIAHGDQGQRTLHFSSADGLPVSSHVEHLGHMPLPPYIDRPDEASDRDRYQTVFASQPGAIAAPTAGLHFTPEILQKLRARGAEICEITLHVGLGTFQPIRAVDLKNHVMHAESYEIPAVSAQQINSAKKQNRPILAIGTTVIRALEASAQYAAQGHLPELVVAGPAETNIFIQPGFHFRVIDALLTNFHLPKSSLMALVCAFAGTKRTLDAYRHAVQSGYRFYSYGDCMLIR